MTARERCVNIIGKFPEERLPYLAVLLEDTFKLVEAAPTLDERLIAAVKARNIPTVRLETDEKGHVIIDKEKHPDIYDWVVNG